MSILLTATTMCGNAEQRRDEGVPARLRQHALGGVDQDDREVGRATRR